MAKHLFLIRHAKSDWGLDVRDFDRPLNARGLTDAPKMGARLAGYSIQPQLLVSSPAKRALTTAERFAEQLGFPANAIQTDQRIYEADLDALIDVIQGLDNGIDRVALFGHNPGFASLVAYLPFERPIDFPTCAIAHIQFDQLDDWVSISSGAGKKMWFSYPKEMV